MRKKLLVALFLLLFAFPAVAGAVEYWPLDKYPLGASRVVIGQALGISLDERQEQYFLNPGVTLATSVGHFEMQTRLLFKGDRLVLVELLSLPYTRDEIEALYEYLANDMQRLYGEPQISNAQTRESPNVFYYKWNRDPGEIFYNSAGDPYKLNIDGNVTVRVLIKKDDPPALIIGYYLNSY